MTAKRSQALATIVTNPQSTQPLMLAAYLPTAYVGVAWAGSVWGVGGAGGNVYSSITVPAWATAVTVTILGVPFVSITGTPTGGTLGSNVVTVTVTDSSSTVTTKQFRFNVTYTISGAGGQLSANAVPPPAYTNNPYSLDLKTYLSNPTLPLTSTVLTSGTLPTGLTLHSVTGIIDASSVTGTTQSVVLTVTDGASAVAVLHLQLRVKPGLSASTYAPAGVIGQPYQGKVTVSGGSGKYSVQQVVANPLPTGIVVDAKSGNISGQPTALTPTTGAPTTHFQITDLVTGEVIVTTALGGGSKNIVIGSAMPPAASGQLYATDANGAPIAVDAVLVNCGDGSDGDVTIDGTTDPAWCTRISGVNTATRDGYCHNLVIVAGGELNMAGYDLYGTGTLTLDNAPVNAINNRGKVSNVAGVFGTNGGTPGSGSTTNGGNGTGSTTPTRAAGGGGSSGGAGGHGTGTNTGGSGGTTSASNQRRPRAVTQPNVFISLSGIELIYGGTGGGGGGGGGGNGTLSGTGGGLIGGGGGNLTIRFRKISRGGSTAVGAINVNGGDGGNSSNAGSSGQASGGGGGAGAGGYLRVYYGELVGSTATNALTADGGKGGNAGSIVGGLSVTAGVGADGAQGGCIILGNVLNGTSTIVNGANGSAHSGVTGGAGGTCRSNL